MQTTAKSVLRPSWRGFAGDPSSYETLCTHLRHSLPSPKSCFKYHSFQKSFCGSVCDLLGGGHDRVMSARGPTMSAQGPMMSAFGSGEGLAGAVSQPRGGENVQQRRGVRTRMARGLLGAIEEVTNPVVEKDLEFESPLDIVLYPDPRLRAKNAAVKKFDSKLEALCKEMFDVMYRTDGVGLSAPQVGVNFRVMVYNPEGVKGEGVEYVLVNPKIVSTSKKAEVYTEGCLSFPGLEADVVRPLDVKVQAQNLQGKRFSLTLKGWKSRIFQHEYDHLQGILFHDRMAPEVRDEIYDSLLELEKRYAEATGKKPPESVLKA